MTKAQELKILNKRWTRAILALVSLAVAYGFASLAIDSGSLFEYAATIFFFVWGIKKIISLFQPQP